MNRSITYAQAINEATDQSMERDERVYLLGLGVPDPKGVFGTTSGLQAKYGVERVLDTPASENAMTGIALGSAIAGKRPVMVHQRVEFAMLAFDQIINQAANWHYMFGGKSSMPLVIRMLVGRGWGQGPQHSQSLHAMFAAIPGLKVLMPVTPRDAKGLLAAAIEDNNPVIYIEHRWLHHVVGEVPTKYYTIPIGEARVARYGADITIIAVSYMVLEALAAADVLHSEGIEVEVIDLRSIKPLDTVRILESVKKTGKALVLDLGWKTFGMASEIMALLIENIWSDLKSPPKRITLPDVPTPATPGLAKYYYPRADALCNEVRTMLDRPLKVIQVNPTDRFDQPNKNFNGPF
jgi:pyruvate/2-oxoglutarate/acetoin dehydrogenase E1 component